jgi:alpha-glucan,water dikinase
MHRANLCKDLLGEALALPGPNKEATLRALYVWMRYSAVRAITWQRNYNTQPRCVRAAPALPSSPLQRPREPTLSPDVPRAG